MTHVDIHNDGTMSYDTGRGKMTLETQSQPTCAQRVKGAWKATRRELRGLLDLWYGRDTAEGRECLADRGMTPDDDAESLIYEHGLSFDYVEPGTFAGQREGFWRYQLSWGGPSDEIRFYLSPGGSEPYRISYCFMDWFDGAGLEVTRDEVAREVWAFFEPVWDGYNYET